MASWTYTTRQGDTWDSIALDTYGTEMLAGYLEQANPGYTNLVYFPAGIVLKIPATPAEATAGQPAPWKRTAESSAPPSPVGKIILEYTGFLKGGSSDHSLLSNREKKGQHTTSAIIHGASQESLEDLLNRLIAFVMAGGPFYGRDLETGNIFMRDNPAEFR